MEGDKRIDELMLPVLNSINRHVKDRDAKTDIYNRAYEAVINSIDVNVDTHLNDKVSIDLQARIDELTAENAVLKSENVNLSKKVTDYEKELRQLHKYDNTCSTCRYLDENQNCVLGIRCVNYTLWQGKIL